MSDPRLRDRVHAELLLTQLEEQSHARSLASLMDALAEARIDERARCIALALEHGCDCVAAEQPDPDAAHENACPVAIAATFSRDHR